MCDTSPPPHSTNRRSFLGAAMAGTGLAVASSLAGPFAREAQALPLPAPTPLRPLLPVLPFQPKGTVLTQLGTAGGPQAEYVRTGTSTVLTVEGYNYVVDCGRASVTQYLNSGLLFGKLAAIFITHLHADHLADYYNYFLLESGQPNAEGDMLPFPPPRKPGQPGAQPLPVYGPGSAGALPPQPAPPYGPVPTIVPDNPMPGIKTLTDRMTEAFAYSYNVFLRGDGYQSINIFTSDVNEIAIPASAHASATNRAPAGMAPFKVFEDDRVKVSAILVPHGEVFPCFAYRFDTAQGSVVFSGDTSCPREFTPAANNVIKLAQGADVLVHEVMNWDLIEAVNAAMGRTVNNDPLLAHLRNSHTTTEEVGQVAQAAGVPQLVLTHLIPSNPLDTPDARWKAKCSVGYDGNVLVGNDFNRVPLPIRR